MSYLHYHSTRARERDPYDDDPYYTRPLVRRNSKRQRIDVFDDEEYDDYPYSSSHKPSKPSRALTIRQPSQLEKYNIWSSPSTKSRDRDDDDDEDRTYRYKYTTSRYTKPSYSHAHSDDEDEREREFRLKVRATFGRPKSSHSSSHKAMAWPGDLFKRREKWEGEDWESSERERRDSFWDEEPALKERTVRYRRIKRTKTDEWKPLSGFRRS